MIGYINQMVEHILASNPNVNRSEVLKLLTEWVNEYKVQASKYINDPEHRLELVKEFYQLVDESIKELPHDTMKNVKCKKGCAHCCHVQVIVSLCEAQYILEHCKKNNIALDVEYLKNQASLREPNHFHFSPFKKCVFLNKNNECSVYSVRPITCRRYFVVTDPELCRMDQGPQNVGIVATISGDLMQSGLMAADQAWGSFAEMLLRAIELDGK